MAGPLIILGASARAAAQSAKRASYEPWCIDLFTDRDLQRIATAQRCPGREYPTGMLRRLDDAPRTAPVLLTGALENYPDFLQAVAFERELLGASVEAIQQVRDPSALPSLPTMPGLKFCKTRADWSLMDRLGSMVLARRARQRYLLKPRRSAGGVGIDWWRAGAPVDERFFLQQYVAGTSYSAVFHADGWSASLMGVTEQLVGEADFGAAPFRYCGSLGPVHLTEQARGALAHLAVQLTQRYDVRGIFGVDLIMDADGTLWPVEVNPRYVASIEVLERAFNLPLLARLGGSAQHGHGRRAADWHGKAIVFAHHDGAVGDLEAAMTPGDIADIPHPGSRVRRGRPICTVFATGGTRDECRDALTRKAQRVYDHAGNAAGRPASQTAPQTPQHEST